MRTPGDGLAAILDARERLAHELHDELTHRVASVSLQVMGHRGSDDSAQLRTSLETIAVATAAIATQLGHLERVLRAQQSTDDDRSSRAAPGLQHLRVCDSVAAVIWRQVQTLRDAGFGVDVALPDRTDCVGPLARRTLEEAVTTARETVTRHAIPGSRCAIEVTTVPGSISLRVTAPVSERWSTCEDRKLIALHERVRLTGGTLGSASQDSSTTGIWSLTLVLRDH